MRPLKSSLQLLPKSATR
uniref:Uncharacterized protein n=1 Tax=Arundo donax TaxID=35708 RepID=A0A0A9HSJ9_ARUDO